MTLESLKASCALRIVDLEMYMTHCEITTSKSVPTLKRNLAGLSNTRYRDVCREQIKCLCEIADCRATIKSIDRLLEERLYPTVIYTESMEINSDSMLVSNDKINGQQNMTDVVGMDVEEKDAGDTHATEQGQRNLLGLQDFLSRPIPLTSFQIPVSTDVSVELSIWDLFTLNPAVRAKLRNYAFLRGNLHVRIAVSGMPFHSGRLLASYQPYPLRNENITQHKAAIALLPTWRPLFLNYLSQAPGAVTIDVKENQPVDIKCPFISPKPMHRLYNSSASVISDVTSYVDLENAGDLFIYSINQVASTSTTPSSVSVYIYGWMENVELGTVTATQVGITTESKELGDQDERVIGPVEKFATNAANVSDALAVVPELSPFALASSMILRGVSGIASIFGWSKPVMIDSPSLVKNVGFQNGAQVTGYDTTYRITLDPKQEITVDPRALGDSMDEMVIAHIASIESYLTTFAWNDDSPVMASPLWNSAVVPNLCTTVTNVAEVYAQPTAMAFAADPFYFWRGTIKFRFEIVCSAFHRGKLAFFFEPNIAQATIIDAALDTNKQYIKVIDIQETQNVEFCVNWAYPRAWAPAAKGSENRYYGPAFFPSLLYAPTNGYIGVTPLTTLQSPDNSDISINVYVSCDDLQVNQYGYLRTDRRIVTESREIVSNHDVTCFDLNESTADDSMIALEHFGERPLSFRSLLKRYTTTHTESVVANASAVKTLLLTNATVPVITPSYGNSVSNSDLFSYLRYAFVGLRGGLRKRLHYWGDWDQINTGQFKVSMDNPTTSTVVIPSATFATTPSHAVPVGTISMVPHSNGGLEFELPFYSNNLFAFSFASDLVGTNGTGEMETYWSKSYTAALDSIGSTSAGEIDEETGAGEDFTMLRFQGAPFYRIA